MCVGGGFFPSTLTHNSGPAGVFWTVSHLFADLVQLKWSEQDVTTLGFNATKARRQLFRTAF